MEAHNGGGGCERECDPQPRRRRAKSLELQKTTGCHVWQLAAPLCVVGLRVRAAGGNANNGTNAGASYTNANNTASNANANYSAPLNFA